MSQYVEVVPAYGRDYANQKDARADWEGGKDFWVAGTMTAVSKREADDFGLKVVIRYSKLMKVMSV